MVVKIIAVVTRAAAVWLYTDTAWVCIHTHTWSCITTVQRHAVRHSELLTRVAKIRGDLPVLAMSSPVMSRYTSIHGIDVDQYSMTKPRRDRVPFYANVTKLKHCPLYKINWSISLCPRFKSRITQKALWDLSWGQTDGSLLHGVNSTWLLLRSLLWNVYASPVSIRTLALLFFSCRLYVRGFWIVVPQAQARSHTWSNTTIYEGKCFLRVSLQGTWHTCTFDPLNLFS